MAPFPIFYHMKGNKSCNVHISGDNDKNPTSEFSQW